VNAAAARAALDDLAERWGQRYPAIIRLWNNAWEQFIPFLDYDVEIRQVICSADENVNRGGEVVAGAAPAAAA
jgi:putative transposase